MQKILLGTVAAAGAISVTLIAPNAMWAMSKLGLIPHRRQKEVITRARNNLIKSGHLVRNKKGYFELTEKGKVALRRLELHEFKLKKPKRWDEKWRVLIFDIREERKTLRDKVRNTLITIGFKWVQDSVWAYPYPCEDFIALLKADFKIGKDLLYIIADEIENDRELRLYFGLPLR